MARPRAKKAADGASRDEASAVASRPPADPQSAFPPPNPRRPNRTLLAVSLILFAGWLVFLLLWALRTR
jgi:hypothetical protein